MPLLSHPLVPVIALIVSSCLWGLSWIPLKALGELGFEGVFIVFSGQVILMFLFILRGVNIKAIGNHISSLLGIFICGGGAILCFTYALIYGDVVRVMVLFYLLPVWGVLGGKFFLGEEADWLRWTGVACALIGAFFILGNVSIFSTPPNFIDFIAFLSGVLFAANNIFFRGVETLDLSTKLLTMFSGCTFICLITILLTKESFPVEVPANNYLWLVLYALTWLLIANVFAQWAVTKMEAGRSSIIIIFELFAAVLSAVLIGGEKIEGGEAIGGVLVVFAAMLEAFRQNNKDRLKKNTLVNS